MKSILLYCKGFFFCLLSLFAMSQSAEAFDEPNADKKGDYAQAIKLYEQACNDGVAGACYNLGMLTTDSPVTI